MGNRFLIHTLGGTVNQHGWFVFFSEIWYFAQKFQIALSRYPYNFPERVHHYLLFTDEKTKTWRVWCHIPKVTQLTNIGLNIKSLVPTSVADSWIEKT